MLNENANLFHDLLYINDTRDVLTDGQRSSEENVRRPKEVRLIQTVRYAINENLQLTIREIAMIAGCSKSSVHHNLHDNLKISKVCARWVLCLLGGEGEETRVRLSTQFLRRHAVDQNFLRKIVIADETWSVKFLENC